MIQSEFLDVTVTKGFQKPMELLVIELHAHPFSRPR